MFWPIWKFSTSHVPSLPTLVRVVDMTWTYTRAIIPLHPVWNDGRRFCAAAMRSRSRACFDWQVYFGQPPWGKERETCSACVCQPHWCGQVPRSAERLQMLNRIWIEIMAMIEKKQVFAMLVLRKKTNSERRCVRTQERPNLNQDTCLCLCIGRHLAACVSHPHLLLLSKAHYHQLSTMLTRLSRHTFSPLKQPSSQSRSIAHI